jgi:hypothetical protein
MAKADRIAKRIEALEAQYLLDLTSALRTCADGQWGLFEHNDARWTVPAVLDHVSGLMALGSAIDRLRAQLGEPPYPLHERFMSARGRKDENQPGEPKLAELWLTTL